MTAKLLDRKALLKKEELQVVKVDLGKDEFVYVRQMTGRERDTFEQSLVKEVKDKEGNVTSYDRSLTDFRAKLAVCTLSNEKGESLLEPGDYELLSMSMSAARLEKIVNEAQKINKISEEDKEALTKNSVAGQAGSSPSVSVSN
jgi:ABC-type ATPase involved in cell division